MRKRHQVGCHCRACVPPHCSWVFAFLGCAGFARTLDGVAWTISLAGTVVASGTGRYASVDSTSLSGGPIVVTASKAGFVSVTQTVATTSGTCTSGHPNSIFLFITMTPDSTYACCPSAPGATLCPDPLSKTLTLVNTVGSVGLTYDDAFGWWTGIQSIPGTVYSEDSYYHCTSTTGFVPCSWLLTCGASGLLTYAYGIYDPNNCSGPANAESGCVQFIGGGSPRRDPADACYPQTYTCEDTVVWRGKAFGTRFFGFCHDSPFTGPVTIS